MQLDPDKQSLHFLQQLQTQRFAVVDFPLNNQRLRDSAAAFLEFLALPSDIKRQLHFKARFERASADGYTDKLDCGDKDPKEFFHWSPLIEAQPSYQSLAQQNTIVSRFFTAARQTYDAVNQVLYPLFVEHFPDYVDELFNGESLRDGTLRFLSYAPQTQPTKLDNSPATTQSLSAKAHFDKGFSTLAIAESAAGLRVGSCEGAPLQAVQHADGKALFMPAWMLYERSAGQILPAWHDVVHNPVEPLVTDYCARWAIVFFVNHPDRTFSSWHSVHSPLGGDQDKLISPL